MNTLVYFFLLFLALFIPVRFHLHLHRIGKDDFFQLELRFLKYFSWRYQVPFEESIPPTGKRQEEISSEEGPFLADHHSDKIRIRGLMEFFTQVNQVYSALEKYGLGGTLFYLFLPKEYRRFITVAEKIEENGRFTRFVWHTTLGFEDPALTGVCTGLLWELKGIILALVQKGYRFVVQPQIRVTPSFNTANFDTLLDCIFEIKLGHIILAGIQEIFLQHAKFSQHSKSG